MSRGGRGWVMATGGTGGHIYPALAVAKAAAARGIEVTFLGQAEGMEARVVPQEGFAFVGVAAGKWDRARPDPRQALRAGWGLVQAVRALRRLEPALVVGFGGFASFPGLAAARWLRLPHAIHEGNAYPGWVTRLFAKSARLVALSHEAAKAHLPAAHRLELTGFPVRESRVPKAEARARLGLPETGVLTLVMGGSQGSAALNAAVPRAFAALAEKPLVLHSTGPRWLEQVRAQVANPSYHLTGFVDATLAWSAADLAITRAGVSTLAEAAYHGVPCLMVPLPSSAEDHQRHNARAVAAAGAGWVVEERELERLAPAWQRALEPEVRTPASACARRLSPAGAARALVDLLERELAGPSRSPRHRGAL